MGYFMIKIKLIAVGDIKENYLKDAVAEYVKRLKRYCSLEIVEIKESVAKSHLKSDIELALKKDAQNITKHISGHFICLDIAGSQMDSIQFAKHIALLSHTNSVITFLIGASNGIDQSVKHMAKEQLSFSKMTFAHQLMRPIFLEQLYRAFTIVSNTPYHK